MKMTKHILDKIGAYIVKGIELMEKEGLVDYPVPSPLYSELGLIEYMEKHPISAETLEKINNAPWYKRKRLKRKAHYEFMQKFFEDKSAGK